MECDIYGGATSLLRAGMFVKRRVEHGETSLLCPLPPLLPFSPQGIPMAEPAPTTIAPTNTQEAAAVPLPPSPRSSADLSASISTDSPSDTSSASLTNEKDSQGTHTDLKRRHNELDDKTEQELVDLEKSKIQKISTLVEEVKQDATTLNAKIVDAKTSKSIEERRELIGDIRMQAAEVEEKVVTAAQLESEVKEINEVLKEKKGIVTPPPAEPPQTGQSAQ